jgi:hypothetical protein
MVQVVEKQVVDLGSEIIKTEEEIEESLIDKKLLRNQAIRDNKELFYYLGLISGASLVSNIGAIYLNTNSAISLIINSIFALNMAYFTYMTHKSIKMSYDFLVDKYENSID